MSESEGTTEGSPVESEKVMEGGVAVSIPESVVAPLIGAGANVYILTNELTQSMREKLGTSWPFVQDTLNSRYAKLLAGGVLASVAAIIFWKIVRRLSSKSKPCPDADEEAFNKWKESKGYQMQMEGKGMGPRAEGEGGGQFPQTNKVPVRATDGPLQSVDNLCKARDSATRNRHTRRREQPGGESTGADPSSPWQGQQQGHRQTQLECSCPAEPCEPAPAAQPPQPRLLYSVRESRMVQRAMDLSDPGLVNLLTYTSCPASLCPPVTVLPSLQPGLCGTSPASPLVTPVSAGLCSMSDGLPHVTSSPAGLLPASEYAAHAAAHHCSFNAARAACHPLQQGTGLSSAPVLVHTGHGDVMRTSLPRHADIVSLCSGQDSQPPSALSSMPEAAVGQVPTRMESEGRPRSGSRQTEGHLADEKLNTPCQESNGGQDNMQRKGVQAPQVPTRVAQSPVTPSQCNTAPLRPDHIPMHLHAPVSCPTHLTNPLAQSFPNPIWPVVYKTPQGAVYASSWPASHYQNSLACQNQLSAVLSSPASPHLQPVTYHQHPVADQSVQQPVVQQPSDSSVSQNSSEVCATQGQQRDGRGHGNCGSQGTTPPDVVPRDTVTAQQEQLNTRRSLAHAPPAARAITDYAHSDFPWRAGSPHGYQPNPVYVIGYQAPHQLPQHHWHQSPWSSPMDMFMSPSPVSAPAGLFTSSPTGVFTTPSGQFLGSHFHTPFLYPQPSLPEYKTMAFNPNFNLSNSNKHVLLHQPGTGQYPVASMAHFIPESGRIRLIGSDTSMVTTEDTNVSTVPAREAAATTPSSSVGTLKPEDDVLTPEAAFSQPSWPEPNAEFYAETEAATYADSCQAVAASTQLSDVTKLDIGSAEHVTVSNVDMTPLDNTETFPADEAVGTPAEASCTEVGTSESMDHVKDIDHNPSSNNNAAPSDGIETQL